MTPVVLIGGGGHCLSVIDVLEAAHVPIAGVVLGEDGMQKPVLGYPVLGRDADLESLRMQFDNALVVVGHMRNAMTRRNLFTLLQKLDFHIPAVIAPSAHVSSHAAIAQGTVVMHHALVNAGAQIDQNCIINTKALVEHDCKIDKHCHVAVGAILCGGVRVEEGAFIGAGAVVKQGIHIGRDAVVGMGCVVRHDIPAGTVYVGKK